MYIFAIVMYISMVNIYFTDIVGYLIYFLICSQFRSRVIKKCIYYDVCGGGNQSKQHPATRSEAGLPYT